MCSYCLCKRNKKKSQKCMKFCAWEPPIPWYKNQYKKIRGSSSHEPEKPPYGKRDARSRWRKQKQTQDARRKIRVQCSELLLPARVAGAPSVRGLCVPRPATTAVCVEDVQIAQFSIFDGFSISSSSRATPAGCIQELDLAVRSAYSRTGVRSTLQ